MNWLAHVFLSRPEIDFQLGNLLADRISANELTRYSEGFAAGVRCHREIDRFTDSHATVRKSKGLIFPRYRHFAAVLVDVYYDHLLVRNWDRYSDISYEIFVQNFYSAVRPRSSSLGHEARLMLNNIIKYNVIGHYDSIEGVGLALQRLSCRVRRPDLIDISGGAGCLEENLEALDHDFRDFFPQLREHIKKLYL